jgi:hypothetical protein
MWKQDESGRVHTPLEPVVLGATLALIPVLVIESDATSEGWQRFAEVANWIIWALFATSLPSCFSSRLESGPRCALIGSTWRSSSSPSRSWGRRSPGYGSRAFSA